MLRSAAALGEVRVRLLPAEIPVETRAAWLAAEGIGVGDRPADALAGGHLGIVAEARAAGLQPLLIDPDREAVPVASAAIRAAPAAHWRWIAAPARALYQRRLVLVGAESTGKSSLARWLTDRLGGPMVPEHGRAHEHARRGDWSEAELAALARAHGATRAALAPLAGPLLIEDTDELMTACWAEMLLGRRAPRVEALIRPARYLLLDADTPFHQDGLRYFEAGARARFHDRIRAALDRAGARHDLISGDWASRRAQALAIALEELP